MTFLPFSLNSVSALVKQLRYANNTQYKKERIIRKEAFVSDAVIAEMKRIVNDGGVLHCDDTHWPQPNKVGRQELEVVGDSEHVSFSTAKIGSLIDVQSSDDPNGLRTFYYIVQDLKCFVFSLMSLHFKISPL